MSATVLADTHVHFHQCFDRELFFQAALRNFRKVGETLSSPDPLMILCLTEKPGEDFYGSLFQSDSIVQLSPTCKEIKYSSRESIHIVAGRQVYSNEGLEILALNTAQRFDTRLPLGESIRAALDSGATVVLNWCFGKWWGERGRVLRQVAKFPLIQRCFIGDVPLRFSKQIDSALLQELGVVCLGVLFGSDPLPFKSELSKPGSFGSYTTLSERPQFGSVDDISTLLAKLGTGWTSFGSRDSALEFLRRQFLNQIHRA